MLKDSGIEAFADHLIESKCKNIIVLTGAGISTAAGYLNLIRIPDFRTKGTGLYSNLKKYNLPYPEAIFDINYFMRKPHAFYELARELYPGKFKPTKCHLFVKSLSDSELLLRNYTQNIDMLERLAEIPEDLIVESHGSFNKATCVGYSTRLIESSLDVPPIEAISNVDKITAQETATASTTHNDSNTIPSSLNEPIDCSSSSDNDDELDLINGCRKEYSLREFKSFLNTNSLPRCECKGLIKPNITFFGENLPFDFYRNLESDFQKCDALIVIGTSLQVHPFAGLIDMVKSNVPRLLINRELAGNFIKQNVTNTSGFYRDAIYLGDCDQGVEILAKRLGISLNVDDDLANEIQKLGI